MLVEDPVFKRGYSILDTGCKIQDAGWMNRMVGWLSHGRVPCALSLEPYVFVRYRMQDTGCKMLVEDPAGTVTADSKNFS